MYKSPNKQGDRAFAPEVAWTSKGLPPPLSAFDFCDCFAVDAEEVGVMTTKRLLVLEAAGEFVVSTTTPSVVDGRAEADVGVASAWELDWSGTALVAALCSTELDDTNVEDCTGLAVVDADCLKLGQSTWIPVPSRNRPTMDVSETVTVAHLL